LTVQRPGKRDYYFLFLAQALALVSTGLATVALALLAYQLAGADAGVVFGTALAIKIVTAVGIVPFASSVVERLPRRPLLVGLDLLRASIALMLPWVTDIWQIFVLIFVFQAASGLFTLTYQALVPELLTEEADYTRALSRSRLMYELEGAISPSVAAALLLVLSVSGLFLISVLGLLASVALVLCAGLPRPVATRTSGPLSRLRYGLRIFRATPRLRALAALNLAVAAAGAMATVNTVVFVQDKLGLDAGAAAVALTVYGVGSALAAFVFPRAVRLFSYRRVMLAGGSLAAVALSAGVLAEAYAGLLVLWFSLGFGGTLAATPAGALLRRTGGPADRGPIYGTQFFLANACQLLTFPLAGWLAARGGADAAFVMLAVLAVVSVVAAAKTWPGDAPNEAGGHATIAPEDVGLSNRS
jgi:MFS family permease